MCGVDKGQQVFAVVFVDWLRGLLFAFLMTF